MRTTIRKPRRRAVPRLLTLILLSQLSLIAGCGGLGGLLGGGLGGAGGGPLGFIFAVVQLIQNLPNPVDTELQAAAQPTADAGIITDQLLGRNIVATAIFGFEAEASAGTLGPDGRIYYTERVTGRVRAFDPATLASDPNPVVDLAVNSSGQRGLKGVCFSPDGMTMFVTYTSSTTGNDSTTEAEGDKSRVSSFPFANGAVTGMETVLISGPVRDALFPSDINTIGKCEVGPDGKLYFAHGDLNSRFLAQNPATDVLAGKIHRVNPDGTIPSDNPLGADNTTYCLGLRHPADFTFDSDPQSSDMWILDNGNIISDELNAGAAGANFGWPVIQGLNNTDPEVILTTVTVGLFYRNPRIDFGQTPINPMGVVVLRNSPYGTDLEGDVLIGQNDLIDLNGTLQGQVVRWSLDSTPFILRTPLFQTAVQSGPIADMFTGSNGFVFIVTPQDLYRVDPA
ncbi:MAG: PQQ-dependent sugar dehydrogenase [Phycisphaerae bacterium]